MDDEPDILDAIVGYLKMSFPEADIATAPNGSAAFDLLQRSPADLVLSDFKMPVMDGLKLIERVRSAFPGTPTVLLTAYPDMHLAIRALNEGRVRQFLTKPIEPTHLREVVRGLLEERLAMQQREAAFRRAAGAT